MRTSSPTAAASLTSALRDAINAGRWPPGAALRQEELAAEFGVSRIPVRDALSALQAEALVVVEPNRGAFVAGFSAQEMSEVFDLRVLLECEALRHAVPRHTEATVRRLATLQRQLDAEDDVQGWARGDRAFHDALYAPCERPRTLQIIASLRGSVQRFYVARLQPGSRRAGWHDEHHALLSAVQARDVDKAVEVLTRHLRETQSLAVAAVA
ncbi:GntR family transcriptional regulator [Ideonella sp. BN130291]|uniref:GntR family transcriptional regulator n=1 Tax=Ideonella sp. BN130291 TaxID=3112940 RepID=UPI002E254729|nr:GntR family transcriptional regulator [Ideonella sp. BN130291]